MQRFRNLFLLTILLVPTINRLCCMEQAQSQENLIGAWQNKDVTLLLYFHSNLATNRITNCKSINNCFYVIANYSCIFWEEDSVFLENATSIEAVAISKAAIYIEKLRDNLFIKTLSSQPDFRTAQEMITGKIMFTGTGKRFTISNAPKTPPKASKPFKEKSCWPGKLPEPLVVPGEYFQPTWVTT